MTDPETSDRTLTMRRSFEASPERVFDAWIQPETVRQWLFTGPETNQRVEIDARVGGTYTITDRRGGEEYTAVGEYEEVDRPNRLVFTFAMPQFSPEEDRIVVEFEPDDGGCSMTFTQEGLSWPPEHAADYKRESKKGWVEMFDNLADRVEADFDRSAYDVTITRTFDAPRQRVWEAWTAPEQVAQWWGPESFTVPRCEMDVRPGGVFRIDMEAPDGTVYPSEGVFDEVDEPERLVLTGRAVEDDDGNYQLEVRQTVTFEERGDTTELTLEAEAVAATPDVVEHLEGMEAGWSQSLEKLAGYVETRPRNDETEIETSENQLTVRRTFDAPPERVFRAFTDPNELEQWYAPGDVTTQVHALEPEPDGAFSISFGAGDDRTDIHGTFVDVAENERIVHTWNYPGEEESRVTYEFRDVDEGTEVVLTHGGIGPYRDLSAGENVEGYGEGWTGALANLDAVL